MRPKISGCFEAPARKPLRQCVLFPVPIVARLFLDSAMSTVAVSKEVLLWAMDRSDQSVEDLLPKFPKLQLWLNGESKPTLRQVEAFARSTRTPFGMFFLSKPPTETLPIPHY